MDNDAGLKIGWASADITPEAPVQLCGQFHVRISEGVMDPVTATVLVLSRGDGPSATVAVLVSCDLVGISPSLMNGVRQRATAAIPGLDPRSIVLNATHTHTGPDVRATDAESPLGGSIPSDNLPVALEGPSPADYVAWAVERIAAAVVTAWNGRQSGSIGFGLGYAVVGRNRRVAYYDGSSRMYGETDAPDFSHIEGYEDHAVNLLGTWDEQGRLAGLVVNVACPSQVSEQSFQISADYWHDTRVELRRRLGQGLFVLPQCSAAGDQSPHVQFAKPAEQRMWRLADRSPRQEIATRIADAASAALPLMEKERASDALLAHRVETVELPRRTLSQRDVDESLVEAEAMRTEFEAARRDLAEHPEKCRQPRWYVPITRAWRRMKWFEGVRQRFEQERERPRLPVELHAIRIGDVAMATNPFEYYLDYGVQMQARSPATQTFVVQLAGEGTYLPTERAISGRSYGAMPASTPVGPPGGRQIVEWTIATLGAMWKEI